MRILFVAAIPMEFRGILARASKIRRDGLGTAVTFAGQDCLLVANGMGWKRAAAAVDAAAHFRPDAIVSTGFCGALDCRLGIADIVAATAVIGDGGEWAAHSVAAPHRGSILSIDRVAQTAEEKRELRATGALAVEMEAAAVARAAAERCLPFYCVRAVTDLAEESMANDFNRALRSDGHLDTIFILRGAFCRPTSRIPELLRLRRRCARAAEALGDFFVGCRF